MSNLHTELFYPVAALGLALAGSATDIRSRRIPNMLTLPGILFGLLLHLALGGWKALALAGLAGLICGIIFAVFWIAGGMGAGDVKLITAVGCIGGLSHAGDLLLSTALAGGAMAIVLALSRGRLRQTLANVGALAVHHRFEGLAPHPELNVSNAKTLRLPYALAIAGGCAVTLCLTVARG
jgi:prepilin peptidase CpaA